MLLILASLMVVSVSAVLFKWASGSLSITRPNMVSFIFYVYLLLMSYLGAIVIYLFPDEEFNRIIYQIYDEKTKFNVWLAVSYSLLAFPLGLLLAKKLLGVRSSARLFNAYTASPLVSFDGRGDAIMRLPLYFLSAFCVAIVVYVYLKVGVANLINGLVHGSQIDLLILRANISSSISGNVYLKNIFALTLLPVLSFISFSYYLISKRASDLIWFGSTFAATILFLVHDLQKSPFVMYLLGYVFIYVYLKGAISKKLMVFFIVLFLLILSFVYVIITKNTDFMYMFSPFEQGLIGRILISEISSLYAHFEFFPVYHDFIGINSISNWICNITSEECLPRSGRLILENYAADWVEKGYGGVFNTLFIGEAWANFGLIGLVLSPLWVGFVIGLLYFFLLKSRKTPVALSLLVYFSYKSSVAGGINDYIYNPKLFILIFILVGVILISQILGGSFLMNRGYRPIKL